MSSHYSRWGEPCIVDGNQKPPYSLDRFIDVHNLGSRAGSVGSILAGGFPSKRETILAVVGVSGVSGSDMLAAAHTVVTLYQCSCPACVIFAQWSRMTLSDFGQAQMM